jgi:hypothetical protein
MQKTREQRIRIARDELAKLELAEPMDVLKAALKAKEVDWTLVGTTLESMLKTVAERNS